MTQEIKQTMFEKNIMPKLIEEYKRTGNKNKVPFNLKKIRTKREEGGFGIFGWEGQDLQNQVDDLVSKKLIIETDYNLYHISDLGLEWKPEVEEED